MACYHFMNSSAKSVVYGASSYCGIVSTYSKYRKIFKFLLLVVLSYHTITNSFGRLKKYFCVHVNVNINTVKCLAFSSLTEFKM